MEGFAILRPLLHTAVQYLSVALVIILVIRLFSPPRGRYPSGSPMTRLNRFTDPIVLPIESMLPPGTSPAVAVVLAIFLVLMAGYFYLAIVDDLLIGVLGFLAGLLGGRPVAALGALLYAGVSLFTTIVIVRILFSWIRVGYYTGGALTRFIYDTTEPVLAIFRGLIPPIAGFDLSPILLFFLLSFVKNAIRGLLM